MPQKETISTRVARLEESMASAFRAIEALADKQNQLDDVMVKMIEARIDDHAESRERERRIDERMDKLVIAIGELISRNGKTS